MISASDREAAYVIDGLMQNEVVKSDIHSTDTHGFSEALFTATHIIDTAFAPRFKKIGDQRIYGFSNKSTYQNEQILDQHTDGQRYYAALESQSLRLQRKVSSVLKAVVFDPASSTEPVLEAVVHFQLTDGHIGQLPPLNFLPQKERDIVAGEGTFRTSLYKILLFQSVADAVRAGKLNLQYSYRYRAIQDYLIPTVRWQKERDRLLTLAGLEKFADGAACLADLKTTLDSAATASCRVAQ